MTSIPTLLNICLEFVSDNPFSLSLTGYDEPTRASSSESSTSYNQYASDDIVFRSDIFFPENIAEKLITLLSRKGKLNDGTMKLFVRETTRLKYEYLLILINLSFRKSIQFFVFADELTFQMPRTLVRKGFYL